MSKKLFKINYNILLILVFFDFTMFYENTIATDYSIIAFGSCTDQNKLMEHWKNIKSYNPDYLFLLGDNVYGDFSDNDSSNLVKAYKKLDENKNFLYLKNNIPIISIWDDHDYGINDGGKSWAHKDISKNLFLKFFNINKNDIRYKREGIYKSFKFIESDKIIKVLALDTRYFKDNFKKNSNSSIMKKYTKDYNPEKTILGHKQWKWFENEVNDDYDLLIILSSFQVISKSHGWEKWNNFPLERKKLFNIISLVKKPVIILSGDRHLGGIYKHEELDIYEITSSSFNKNSFSINEPDSLRLGKLINENNFGIMEIRKEDISISLNSGRKNKKIIYNKIKLKFNY